MKKLSKCLLWVICSAASTVCPITVMLTTPRCTFLLNLINTKQLSSALFFNFAKLPKTKKKNIILSFVSVKQPASNKIPSSIQDPENHLQGTTWSFSWSATSLLFLYLTRSCLRSPNLFFFYSLTHPQISKETVSLL